jgi:hypothetical protein
VKTLFYHRFSLVSAVLFCASPAFADGGVVIEHVRILHGAPGASPTVVVTTTQDSLADVAWVGGTTAVGGGKPSALRFGPDTIRQTGTGEIAWRPSGKGGATLSLTTAEGKVIGEYAGTIDAEGRLSLSDDRKEASSPTIEGFVVAATGKGSAAVVTIVDATAEAAKGLLVIDGVKAEIAFGDVEVDWIASASSPAPSMSPTCCGTRGPARRRWRSPWRHGDLGTSAMARIA